MEKYNRKHTRLKNYNYNTPGYYFITVCTKNKQKILCDIVGTFSLWLGHLTALTVHRTVIHFRSALRYVLDGPQTALFKCGDIAKKQIEEIKDFYPYVKIEKYVIMPNHIHFLIRVLETKGNGPSGTPAHSKSKKDLEFLPSPLILS